MNILSTLQQFYLHSIFTFERIYAKSIRQFHIYAKNVAYILDIRLFGFFFLGGGGGGFFFLIF